MKTLDRIFVILFAILAGRCIQLTGVNIGIVQAVNYAGAILGTGFCFALANKIIGEDE